MNTKKLLAILLVTLSSMIAPHSAKAYIVAACYKMAEIDVVNLADALSSYSRVSKTKRAILGKYPEHWTQQDFQNLINAAAICNGKPFNVKDKVNAVRWADALSKAAERMMKTNSISLEIMGRYRAVWKSEEEFFPCVKYLDWQRDDLWYTNNSKDVFGKSIIDMTPEERGLYLKLSKDCRPVIVRILEKWKQPEKYADAILDSIEDSIKRDSAASLENPDALPKQLRLTRNGKPIYLAHLRSNTKEVVLKVAGAIGKQRIFPPSFIANLSMWTEQTLEANADGPDAMYAEAIRLIVNKKIFE